MGQTTSAKKTESEHVNGLLLQNGELPREFQMNADVWYLIFGWGLRPLDLLNLARTCKYFRQILMAKSSLSVWENSRSQVEGLPDCPSDLSELAYADLVFGARCHGCGRYTPDVFWRIRRRYCSDCQTKHLCRGFSYTMRANDNVLPAEDIAIGKRRLTRFEKSQVNSFIRKYKRADDKKRFLSDRKKWCEAIYEHARQCASLQPTWQKKMEELELLELLERQEEERVQRQARNRCILEHLKKLGYEPEIDYFGEHYFQEPDSSKTVHPLTDGEWAQMLPGWLETMSQHRGQRLNAVVYKPRQSLLESEYDKYVRSPDTPYFDLLPHVDDVSHFPPFRDILNAPERTQLGEEPFKSAFAKLPELVEEWREQLDAQLADLVEIPAHLSLQSTPSRQAVPSTSRDKLGLACALFDKGRIHCVTYPEVFPISGYSRPHGGATTDSIWGRYRIKFSKEAPYVVYACGLDPHVATWGDMRRRNARLKCLICSSSRIMRWHDAAVHASFEHPTPPSWLPCWQVVGDEHIPAIEAVEESIGDEVEMGWQCLLCRPCVESAMTDRTGLEYHLQQSHGVASETMKCEVHYTPCAFGVHDSSWVEMVESNGQVTFIKAHR